MAVEMFSGLNLHKRVSDMGVQLGIAHIKKEQGPVVHSIISLRTLLTSTRLVYADYIIKYAIIFCWKNVRIFCRQKILTFFQQKISIYL